MSQLPFVTDLEFENLSFSESKLVDAILRLSDFYISHPDKETPWSEAYCQLAYRYYYMPLNFLRCAQVIKRGQQNHFFQNLNTFIDWGCGPGTASLALAANLELQIQIKKQILIDHSSKVLNQFKDLTSHLIQPQISNETQLKNWTHLNTDQSCLVMSYSLTEVSNLPSNWNEFEALMILEPSTSEDGRRLLNIRSQLLQAGYTIWAPCTHQLTCPLLTESKNDWCHDRIHVEAPEWFKKIEQKLPMKNNTITTSYLLARKKSRPETHSNIGRLTGDSREEKGKTRQLFCRNEKREFLTWMHKKIEPQILYRGDLFELPENYELKANEIRLTK